MVAVIDVYFRDEMAERPKSRQNYRLLLERHIRPTWGTKVLSDVQPYGVEIWLREMQYSPETKRHIKSMVFRLFELAMKRGWIEVQKNAYEPCERQRQNESGRKGRAHT